MDITRITTALALAVTMPAVIASTRLARLDLEPESRLWVSGTSTVRAFQCQAGSFSANIASTGTDAVAAVRAGAKAVSTVEVRVPGARRACRPRSSIAATGR